VCISANYRLCPATFPDPLIDAKKVIAWVREHGHDYGVDAEAIFLAGSSAGAHLASTAALTANDPGFQPGFEHVDTSVRAAIALSGYYGPIETRGPASSPPAYVGANAPPFFVVPGELDTIVLVEDARALVAKLRSGSVNSVVYAELPGAQHSFDLFHSIRFESVVDAIEEFTCDVRSRA
jgi:acetyl esterase/lipase